MAKNRMVSTGFWSDHYVADLDPVEKLLFLYLLTNERSTLAGVYELPVKVMAVETGIETEMVKKILSRFESEDKVKYENGWVAIKNFLKHHEHGSPLVKKGIDDAIKSSPEWAKAFIGKGMDTLSPSASASASISDAPRRVVSFTQREENSESRPKSVPKYKDARIAFSWFPSPEPSWYDNTTELKCGNLLFQRGEEKVKKAIAYVEKHKEDENFNFVMVKPSDYERKWNNIAEYARRT